MAMPLSTLLSTRDQVDSHTCHHILAPEMETLQGTRDQLIIRAHLVVHIAKLPRDLHRGRDQVQFHKQYQHTISLHKFLAFIGHSTNMSQTGLPATQLFQAPRIPKYKVVGYIQFHKATRHHRYMLSRPHQTLPLRIICTLKNSQESHSRVWHLLEWELVVLP